MNEHMEELKKTIFAYPFVIEFGDGTTFGSNGMTLRDYFAAKAMQAEFINIGVEGNDPKFVALMAYEVADAMLEARK